MTVETRLFGTITIDEEKIITFPNGIVGFPDLKEFALMHDTEKSDENGLSFLVSLQEPAFSMPVMNPLLIKADYNPVVEDDYLIPLGELNEEEMLVLVTVTVPHEIEHMSVNLMAPIIVNAATRKAAQVILNDDEGNYPVKFPVYDILAKAREEAEKAGKGDR